MRASRQRWYRRNMRRVFPQAQTQAVERAAQIMAAGSRRARRRALLALVTVAAGAAVFVLLHWGAR